MAEFNPDAFLASEEDQTAVEEPPIEDQPQDIRSGVARRLSDLGVSPVAAAGILGDIEQESGFDPTLSGDRGTSHGLFQVGTPLYRQFQSQMAQQGVDEGDPQYAFDQVQYMLSTFAQQHPDRWQAMQSAQNAPQAVSIFRGTPDWGYGVAGKRYQHATDYEKLIRGDLVLEPVEIEKGKPVEVRQVEVRRAQRVPQQAKAASEEFDPDAFLAASEPFDPDSFLATGLSRMPTEEEAAAAPSAAPAEGGLLPQAYDQLKKGNYRQALALADTAAQQGVRGALGLPKTRPPTWDELLGVGTTPSTPLVGDFMNREERSPEQIAKDSKERTYTEEEKNFQRAVYGRELSPEISVTQATIGKGVHNLVADTINFFNSPEGAAMTAATGGIAAIKPFIGRLITMGFGAAAATQAGDAVMRGDYAGAIEGLGLGFLLGHGARESAKAEFPVASPTRPPAWTFEQGKAAGAAPEGTPVTPEEPTPTGKPVAARVQANVITQDEPPEGLPPQAQRLWPYLSPGERTILVQRFPTPDIEPPDESPRPIEVTEPGIPALPKLQPEAAPTYSTGDILNLAGERWRVVDTGEEVGSPADPWIEPINEKGEARGSGMLMSEEEMTRPPTTPIEQAATVAGETVAQTGKKLRLRANKEGGFINADILQEAIDFGKQVYERGMDYAQWAAEMVRHLGDRIRQHLQDIWGNVQAYIASGGYGRTIRGTERGAVPIRGEPQPLITFEKKGEAVSGLRGSTFAGRQEEAYSIRDASGNLLGEIRKSPSKLYPKLAGGAWWVYGLEGGSKEFQYLRQAKDYAAKVQAKERIAAAPVTPALEIISDPMKTLDLSNPENFTAVDQVVTLKHPGAKERGGIPIGKFAGRIPKAGDKLTSVDSSGERHTGEFDPSIKLEPAFVESGTVQADPSGVELSPAEPPYKVPPRLGEIGLDPKTVKGEKKGFKTFIMYLTAATGARIRDVHGKLVDMCKFRTENCTAGCLGLDGMGSMDSVRDARANKTRFFYHDEDKFLAKLDKELATQKRAQRAAGFNFAVRLNGTSDVLWEKKGIMEKHPDVQFYDYTKYPSVLRKNLPKNYHMTYSYTGLEESKAFSRTWNERGVNTAVVFADGMPAEFLGRPVIDGDATDLRFLDPQGVIVGLHTKGKLLQYIAAKAWRTADGTIFTKDPPPGAEEGFVDSQRRFYTPEQAWKKGVEAGQFSEEKHKGVVTPAPFIQYTEPADVAVPFLHPVPKSQLLRKAGRAAMDAVAAEDPAYPRLIQAIDTIPKKRTPAQKAALKNNPKADYLSNIYYEAGQAAYRAFKSDPTNAPRAGDLTWKLGDPDLGLNPGKTAPPGPTPMTFGAGTLAADGAKLRLRANKEGGYANILLDAADFGLRLYRKGMDFGSWALQMVQHLGGQVREHLGKLWYSITGDRTLPFARERGGIGTAPTSPVEPSDAEAAGNAAIQQRSQSELERLTGAVDTAMAGKQAVAPRVEAAVKASRKIRTGSPLRDQLNAVKSAMIAFKDWYVSPPRQSQFREAVKDWYASHQRVSFEVRRWMQMANKQFPDALSREAITNYVEADGDPTVLQQRADASSLEHKSGYLAAMDLPPEQKVVAENVRQYFDAMLQQAKNEGVLEAGVENYINHMWQRPNKFTRALLADAVGGKLSKNFQFARKRIFDSFFEGEQAGYAPLTKDFVKLLGVYDLSFRKMLGDRAFIKGLREAKAPDGEPVTRFSGMVRRITNGADLPPSAYLIRSRAMPEAAETADGRPYIPFDHPALRGWKFVYQGKGATPTYFESDMLVHPDHAAFLKRILGTSWFRQGVQRKVFQPIFKAGAFAKQTRLSLSLFHLNQEGLHALFHRTNPYNLPEINFDDPTQSRLIRGGLVVSDYSAQELFAEGLRGGGLVSKIPGLGGAQTWFNEVLFKDYIPRLKMAMALHAYERNVGRYPTLSPDVIAELTAQQANAAFGELNYKLMGRSPFVQDLLRLTLLAPDFLEARSSFLGQALKPYGAEQRTALLLGAGTMYITARLLNQWLDNDPHWELKHAFSVIYNGREYQLRSVMGDAASAFSDPWRFVTNRLSPWSRAGWHFATRRDFRGIKMSALDQIKDAASWLVPIPTGSQLGEPVRSVSDWVSAIPQRILGSAGVSNKPSESPVQIMYQNAVSFKKRIDDPKVQAEVQRADQESHVMADYQQLDRALTVNDRERAVEEMIVLMKDKGKTDRDISKYYRNLPRRPFTGSRALDKAWMDQLSQAEQNQLGNAVDQRQRMSDLALDLLPLAEEKYQPPEPTGELKVRPKGLLEQMGVR